MALADVLSAIRVLVMDGESLPRDLEARKVFCERKFPALSAEELEDLARMDPERLAIYTRSIFIQESRMLERHFPATVEVLRELWKDVLFSTLDLRALVQDLHHKVPWRTPHTKDFGANFVEYIETHLGPLVHIKKDLSHLARVELARLEVRRELDEHDFKGAAEAQHLAQLSVESLLSSTVKIPHAVRILRIPQPAAGEESVPSQCGFTTYATHAARAFESDALVMSRTRDLLVKTGWVTAGTGTWLESFTRPGQATIGEMAERFVENVSESPELAAKAGALLAEAEGVPETANLTGEALLFKLFMEELLTLIRVGAIYLPMAA